MFDVNQIEDQKTFDTNQMKSFYPKRNLLTSYAKLFESIYHRSTELSKGLPFDYVVW